MTDDKTTERLNSVLGAIVVAVLLIMYGIDALPGYEVSRQLTMMLVILALVLLGFGALIETYLKTK